MIKEMDYLIIYEHASRELESVCLLKCELERRGYTVKICYAEDLWKRFYRPKVVIVPYAYSDEEVKEFSFFGRYRTNKIVNLQWEQIFCRNDEKKGFQKPTGSAKDCVFLSWGEGNKQFLENCGVNSKNIKVTGAISTDFCSTGFHRLNRGRSYLADHYHIPVNKKWMLFISSFSLTTDYVYRTVEETVGCYRDLQEFRDIQINSQKEILRWFSQILDRDEEILIIYRPHPAELKNGLLNEMQRKYKNFRCLMDLSVREWLYSSDYVYTWYSTSIVEAFFLNKYCGIIRPYVIDADQELSIMEGAKVIRSFDELSDSMGDSDFPIEKKVISRYYGNWNDGQAYKRIADVCVDVLDDNSYAIESKITPPERQPIKYLILRIMKQLCSYFRISKLFKGKKKRIFQNTENNRYKSGVKIRNYSRMIKESI